jgi:DNA end-binding protein Ku
MARSLWTGSLSFGLVNVPVALFSAVRDQDLHFHQLHEKDGARIDTRRFCAKEEEEVPLDEIGHAYDLDNGKTVVVTDEDLEAVAPRKTRTIDIEAFVDLDEVDPIYFDHPYWLAPTGESEGPRRAYQLLVEAMGRSERVALGRFVMRTKEYLVAVQVRDDRLSLTTMLFGDEIRPTKDIETGGKKPAAKALDRAVQLIEALSTDWDPGDWKDCYRVRLEDIIDRKRKGKRISAPKPQKEPSPVPDLMAALERSLADAQGKSGRKPQSGTRATAGSRREKKADLADLSREELYERAQEQEVPGRSSMTKDDLVKALQD